MAGEKQSGQELKGLLLAIIAGVLVVALAFGVSAVMRHVMAPPVSSVSAPTAPSPATPIGAPSPNYTSQMISDGRKYYAQACASCHGAKGQGVIGPSLRNEDMTDNQIATVIKNGKGQMPPFGKQFNDGQIDEIISYVRALK